MAKLATPRLTDVAPTISGLETVIDRLTEVGVMGSPLAGARLTLRSESGALAAAIVLTISDGEWADCTVAVTADADPAVYSRVNRLLASYQIKSKGLVSVLIGHKAAPPKVGNYWRTKKGSMFHAGRVETLPALGEAKPKMAMGGSAVTTEWSVRAKPLVLETNSALGYVEVITSKSKTKVLARRSYGAKAPATTASIPSPTIREAVGLEETKEVTLTPKGVKKGPAVTPPAKAASSLPAGHPGIFRDVRLSTRVHVSPDTDQVLTKAYEGFALGDRTVIILRGPSGSGKTITAMALAAKHNLPFWKVDVAALRDFSDWAGSMTLTADETGKVVTAYQPSQLIDAISADGPYGGHPRMVLLDEINRCETSGALNAAGPILDGTGTLYVPDARKSINIDPAVLFVGTANIGSEFTGAGVLDHMIVTRGTCWWDVDYPSEAVESTILVEQGGIPATTATQLVKVAQLVRASAGRMEISVGVSTRQLVAAALLIKRGLKPSLACRAAFGNTYSPEGAGSSDRTKVETSIRSILGA